MNEPVRIGPQDVRASLMRESGLLLVNIYPQKTYDRTHLEGAISYDDFNRRLPNLPKETEIVFY